LHLVGNQFHKHTLYNYVLFGIVVKDQTGRLYPYNRFWELITLIALLLIGAMRVAILTNTRIGKSMLEISK